MQKTTSSLEERWLTRELGGEEQGVEMGAGEAQQPSMRRQLSSPSWLYHATSFLLRGRFRLDKIKFHNASIVVFGNPSS